MSDRPTHYLITYGEYDERTGVIEGTLVFPDDLNATATIVDKLTELANHTGVAVERLRVWKLLPIQVKEVTTFDIEGLDSLEDPK